MPVAPHTPTSAPSQTPSLAPGSGLFQGASPKLTFIFGVSVGVVAAAIIGVILLLSGVNFGAAKTAKKTTDTAAAPTNTSTTTPDTYGDVKAVSDADYVRGDKNAELTLVEYSDLECPFCKTFHPTMQQIMSEYDGKVRWVYRNFPLSFHANAKKEAEAALCVGKLGGTEKIWDFIDTIFERTTANGTGFALDNLGPLAKEVGVDQTKFQSCLDSGEMAARVDDETADGSQAGVQGTPTTFLVGKDGKTITAFPGALPYAQVKAAIDTALSS